MFISIKLVNKSIRNTKYAFQNGLRLRAISDENARFINEVIQKDTNNALSNELKLWRTRTSQELNKKTYHIFPNKVIAGIIVLKPRNKDQLSIINGVGPKILSAYGESILEIVKKYVGEGDDDNSALLENISSKLVNTSKYNSKTKKAKPVVVDKSIASHPKRTGRTGSIKLDEKMLNYEQQSAVARVVKGGNLFITGRYYTYYNFYLKEKVYPMFF